jgi:hypothetical protein
MLIRFLVTVGFLGALAAPVQAQAAPSTAPGFVSEVMLQVDASRPGRSNAGDVRLIPGTGHR